MIKNLAIAAMAAISVVSFAQTDSKTSWPTTSAYIGAHPWSPGNIEVKGIHIFDLRKRVEKQASICLTGGDQFELESMLDRNPFYINAALLGGLCGAQRQAVMITSKILTQRFPDDGTYASVPDNYDLQATVVNDWSGEGRPLRLVMVNKIKPKDVDYSDALDILSSNLDMSQASIVADWWYNTASERQKDIVCRLLKDDASMADEKFYPSVYVHSTYSWLNDAPPF